MKEVKRQVKRQVNFQYDLDEVVVTALGDKGIVKMLAYDDAGPQYYLQCVANSSWWKEEQCSAFVPVE